MIKIRILFLMIFLLVPAYAFAQTSAAANKSWSGFWTQFSQAVNKKNKAAVKRLMSSENDFFSGGGIEDRDGWLQLVEKNKWWDELQKSVAKGTVPYNEGTRPGRITKDRHLIFEFIGGKWRFVGPMGD